MKTNPSEMLDQQIVDLEQKREEELYALKQHWHVTGDSLQPANLLKSVVQDVTSNDQMKSFLLKAGIGLALGYIANKVVAVRKRHTSRSLLGKAVNVGVNLLVANRYGLLKSAGALAVTALLSNLNKRRQKRLAKKATSLDTSSEISYSAH